MYISVSDLTLCQKCPALFAYKIFMREKSAWRVGIQGENFYGSIFHKNIAQVFFEAAENPQNSLHEKIYASLKNIDALENVIRENIFLPFLEKSAKNFSGGQIIAMARAIKIWVKAMSEFFGSAKNRENIFLKPEQKLQWHYDFPEDRLNIIGCYDALIFNSARNEARLFEFKGYRRDNIAVPLSQSLIYAWLIYKSSGIVPSIEIIYLDEAEKSPDIFSSENVYEMLSNLPGLFRTAFNVILSRRVPNFFRDEKLCGVCKFQKSCAKDWNMTKRRGASLFSVMVFLLLAVTISAQIFFFSVMSVNSINQERNLQQVRFTLDALVKEAKNYLSGALPDFEIQNADYKSFHEKTFIKQHDYKNFHVHINNLMYNFQEAQEGFYDFYWDKIKAHERVFPPMSDDKGHYFLVRAYAELESTYVMYQVLVRKRKLDGKIITLSHGEIWY